MKIVCIIPSRLDSKRLPRKALLPIKGKPMVQRTYENAAAAPFISDVIVATDSEEIADVIRQIGGKVSMTPENISNGTLRVACVARDMTDVQVVINLQGDEPFVTHSMLKELVSPYLNGELPEMTTLAHPLDIMQYQKPEAVKVITNLQQNAIYFSRSPIPFYRNQLSAPVYHHIGMYAFRHDFLMLYQTLPETTLEQVESLEQLRVLEHGYPIRVCITDQKTLEINTPEEYQAAQDFNENQDQILCK